MKSVLVVAEAHIQIVRARFGRIAFACETRAPVSAPSSQVAGVRAPYPQARSASSASPSFPRGRRRIERDLSAHPAIGDRPRGKRKRRRRLRAARRARSAKRSSETVSRRPTGRHARSRAAPRLQSPTAHRQDETINPIPARDRRRRSRNDQASRRSSAGQRCFPVNTNRPRISAVGEIRVAPHSRRHPAQPRGAATRRQSARPATERRETGPSVHRSAGNAPKDARRSTHAAVPIDGWQRGERRQRTATRQPAIIVSISRNLRVRRELTQYLNRIHGAHGRHPAAAGDAFAQCASRRPAIAAAIFEAHADSCVSTTYGVNASIHAGSLRAAVPAASAAVLSPSLLPGRRTSIPARFSMAAAASSARSSR